MLIIISPAKTLDFDTDPITKTHSQPVLLDQSSILIEQLRGLSPGELSSLMSISDKLGNLNHERYNSWNIPFTKANAKQALLAFKGDVYTGLDVDSFSATDFKFAQKHLRILSGLYGVLRPLDLIQPYRLEMGTKLVNQRGKDLYGFWGDEISSELNKQLKVLKTSTLVNLASNEYSKAARTKELNAEIISPVFKDMKNGQYKIISFYAKKARGRMAAWIIKNAISDAKRLRKFSVDGYRYSADMSSSNEPVFIRDEASKS